MVFLLATVGGQIDVSEMWIRPYSLCIPRWAGCIARASYPRTAGCPSCLVISLPCWRAGTSADDGTMQCDADWRLGYFIVSCVRRSGWFKLRARPWPHQLTCRRPGRMYERRNFTRGTQIQLWKQFCGRSL